VLRCLSIDPAGRPTAREIAAALGEASTRGRASA
jgi:hypothetical protein